MPHVLTTQAYCLSNPRLLTFSVGGDKTKQALRSGGRRMKNQSSNARGRGVEEKRSYWYCMKQTQTQRIYDFLKRHQGAEFNHRRIVDSQPNGLGITEYTRPFVELREQFNCLCAKTPEACLASEHIRNTRQHYYIYVNDNYQPPKAHEWVMSIEQKLDQLRVDWTRAKRAKDGLTMARIEMQAKVLKIGLIKPVKHEAPPTDQFVQQAREALL